MLFISPPSPFSSSVYLSLSQVEFLEHMLVTLNKCSRRDVRMVLAMFRSFDRDGGGSINRDDIHAQWIEKASTTHNGVKVRWMTRTAALCGMPNTLPY